MDNWDLSNKVAAGAGLLGLIAVALQKAISFFRAEQANQSSSAANAENFKTLRLQIEALQADNVELRKEFHLMDAKLHRQQTKLTRTEMLVRQFVGLVREHGTPVPAYMQAELDDLLQPDRAPDTRTRATDAKEATA